MPPMLVPYVAGAAAFVAALAALLVYHLAAVRPALAKLRHVAELHDGLIGGAPGAAGERLLVLEEGQAMHRTALEEARRRIGEVESRSQIDVSRIGFVRYDAFDDTGSNLSYALALLNREGSGVVLTSIYSRTDTRTYGKAVERFVPTATASEEELQAIERARLSASNE